MIEVNIYEEMQTDCSEFLLSGYWTFQPRGRRGGGETYLLLSGFSSFIHLVIKRIIVNLFLNKPN